MASHDGPSPFSHGRSRDGSRSRHEEIYWQPILIPTKYDRVDSNMYYCNNNNYIAWSHSKNSVVSLKKIASLSKKLTKYVYNHSIMTESTPSGSRNN
jgi:hypothetical protein